MISRDLGQTVGGISYRVRCVVPIDPRIASCAPRLLCHAACIASPASRDPYPRIIGLCQFLTAGYGSVGEVKTWLGGLSQIKAMFNHMQARLYSS